MWICFWKPSSNILLREISLTHLSSCGPSWCAPCWGCRGWTPAPCCCSPHCSSHSQPADNNSKFQFVSQRFLGDNFMSKSLRCAWRRWWLWVLVRRVTRHWPAPWSGSSPPQTGPAVSSCRRCWLHRGPLRTEHWCVDNTILVPSYTSFLISPPPAPLQRKLGSQDVVYWSG